MDQQAHNFILKLALGLIALAPLGSIAHAFSQGGANAMRGGLGLSKSAISALPAAGATALTVAAGREAFRS